MDHALLPAKAGGYGYEVVGSIDGLHFPFVVETIELIHESNEISLDLAIAIPIVMVPIDDSGEGRIARGIGDELNRWCFRRLFDIS